MSAEEVREGILWINDKFPLIVRQDDELVSIDWILDRARLAVLRLASSYGLGVVDLVDMESADWS